jgi:hypothetical protein
MLCITQRNFDFSGTAMRVRLFFAFMTICTAAFAADLNFEGAKAIVINESPNIELSDFRFFNAMDERRMDYRFRTQLGWKNISDVPVIAFDVVLVKYDAFNRHMSTRRWAVQGHNSAKNSMMASVAIQGL